MKTTKFKTVLLIFLMAVSLPGYSTEIVTDPISNTSTAALDDARGQKLLNRLNEIKDMDKSDLSREEKRELRKEVKSIKKTLTASGKGVYLSVGAIIIVILLLILLV